MLLFPSPPSRHIAQSTPMRTSLTGHLGYVTILSVLSVAVMIGRVESSRRLFAAPSWRTESLGVAMEHNIN